MGQAVDPSTRSTHPPLPTGVAGPGAARARGRVRVELRGLPGVHVPVQGPADVPGGHRGRARHQLGRLRHPLHGAVRCASGVAPTSSQYAIHLHSHPCSPCFSSTPAHHKIRYLGLPQEQPAAYRQGSVLPYVHNLSGRLLLIHGQVRTVLPDVTAVRGSPMRKVQQRQWHNEIPTPHPPSHPPLTHHHGRWTRTCTSGTRRGSSTRSSRRASPTTSSSSPTAATPCARPRTAFTSSSGAGASDGTT